MSLIATRQALEVALFGMTPTIDIAWENQTYVPSSSVPYIRAVLMPSEPENPTMGDGFHRLNGLLYLEFFYPKSTGSATAAARAELTKTTFKRGNSFTNSGVKVIIDKTPEIGMGAVINEWWVLPFRARWHADIQS